MVEQNLFSYRPVFLSITTRLQSTLVHFLHDSYAHISKQNIFHNIEVKYSKKTEYSRVEFTEGGKEPFHVLKKKRNNILQIKKLLVQV